MKFNLTHLGWLVILVLVLWGNLRMVYLKFYGTETKGVITLTHIVGTKGRTECSYTYKVRGELYKAKEQYGDFKEGDTIIVLYFSFYPQISTLKKKALDVW